ncbi:hypothetical protein ABEV74_20545 [Paenibacillus cisolokensis]|uniref:hypothetical protein n=1 Tax=Paenibacillus cisolokensis TaxID=1658519 RepID=UPI003D2C4532
MSGLRQGREAGIRLKESKPSSARMPPANRKLWRRTSCAKLEDERRQHEFERKQHDELRETAQKLIGSLNGYLKELDEWSQKAYLNYTVCSDSHQLGMAEAYEVAEYCLREILKEIGVTVDE